MKGESKLIIDGTEITLRFDLGAIEDFCEETGANFAEWETKVFQSPKTIRLLIYHMARAGGSDIEPELLRRMTIEQITQATELLNQAAAGNGKAKAGKGR